MGEDQAKHRVRWRGLRRAAVPDRVTSPRPGGARGFAPLAAAVLVSACALLAALAVASPAETSARTEAMFNEEPVYQTPFEPPVSDPAAQPEPVASLAVPPTSGAPTSAVAPTPSKAVAPTVAATRSAAPSLSPTPTVRAVTFAAVAGYGCTHTSTRGFSEVGRYTDGKSGWYAASTGGWAKDGCNGKFDSMPMSGYRTTDDPQAYALFWFAVGATTTSCDVSVYIPKPSLSRDVAGKPAQYFVLGTETGPVKAGFTIDQRTNHGRWVSGGTRTVTGGRIVIKLVNRGEDFTDTTVTYEHIGVSQVRVTCH